MSSARSETDSETQLEPLIVFPHIPKTAGTTIRRIISCEFPINVALELKGEHIGRPVLPLIQARLDTLKVVYGHISYGLDEQIERRCRYLTLLRRPAERVVSLYLHLLPRGGRPDALDRPAGVLVDEFRQLVEGEDASTIFHYWGLDNGMTLALSGSPPESVCDEAMLEKALANLQIEDSIVGLTECFDETLVLLQRRWDWRYVHYVNANVSPDCAARERLLEAARELTPSHSGLDQVLYEEAEKRFREEVLAEGPDFEPAVTQFSERNAEFGRAVLDGRLGPRPGDPVVDMNLQLSWRAGEMRSQLSLNKGLRKEAASATKERDQAIERTANAVETVRTMKRESAQAAQQAGRDHRRALAQLAKQNDRAIQRLEGRVARANEMSREWAQAAKQVEREHRRALARLAKEKDRAIQRLEGRVARANEMSREWAQAAKQAERKHRRALARLAKEKDRAIQRLEGRVTKANETAQLAKQKDRTIQRLEGRIAKVKEGAQTNQRESVQAARQAEREYASELVRLTKERDREVTRLRHRASKLKARTTELERALAAEQAKRWRVRARLTGSLRRIGQARGENI